MAGNKRLLLLPLLILVVGCGGVSRKQAAEFRNYFRAGQFKSAMDMITSHRYYPHEKSRLLQFLELGTLHHVQGNYYQSLAYFDAAQELSDKLFTVSVKKKIATFMASDNADNYYGEIYERSQIRLYRALNHMLLAQTGVYEPHSKDLFAFTANNKKGKGKKQKVAKKGGEQGMVARRELTNKEKRFHLQAARAVIVEWDSYLSAQKKVLLGSDQYKADLGQRLLGAHVHLRMESRSDRRIARSLYKDSKELLFKNYNIYPSYNSKSAAFRKNFTKLPSMKRSQIRQKYVGRTEHATALLGYIDEQLKAIKKSKTRGKQRVTLLIQEGFIPQKKAEKIQFPIGFNTLTYNTVSKDDFISFTRKVLAISAAGMPMISFELPKLEPLMATRALEVHIKNDQGQVVLKKALSLINPLKDLAHEALKKRLPALKKKVGARLVAKHLAALMTSYLAYRSASKDDAKKLFALSLATAGYFVANRSIEASEKADLRSWTTLPASLHMADVMLKPGQYQVTLLEKVSGVAKQLGSLAVVKGSKKMLYNKRVF